MGREYWASIMAVRTAVNKEMEVQRAAGLLRGSLDAGVTLYCFAILSSVSPLAGVLAITEEGDALKA